MYEEVSRAPNHFSVVLFLRRCKSTAEKKAKQSLSHNSPEKLTYLGKIGHFLGKIKSLHAQQGKTRKNRKILTKRQENTLIFLQAFPPHSSRKSAAFGKNRGFLGKNRGIIGKISMFFGKMVI